MYVFFYSLYIVVDLFFNNNNNNNKLPYFNYVKWILAKFLCYVFVN
jgi:hypothetical protein